MNPGIENNFMYHGPKEGQTEKYEAIRAKAKELAYLIDELCPRSREQSVAMTNLETTMFWANAAIARN
ncbi:Acb2/Tad1 domain-containing protein [Paenibacillus sp. LjRoot56]|uniref:Acb2/Tad1 domain-containing protein n=1 Tax=Paenibacillus sp. LjRoot56 TaxID=3342333 RepID=UPI003ECDDA1D